MNKLQNKDLFHRRYVEYEMEQVFTKSQNYLTDYRDPRVEGVLDECEGRLKMKAKDYRKALELFQSSF